MLPQDYLNLLADLYEKMSDDVSLLKIQAYKSAEPLGFADRFSGAPQALCEGDKWGEKLFDCAWMRFDVSIPEDLKNFENLALKIDLNGELFIADSEGSPICGLTSKSSSFCDVLGKPGKRFFWLAPEMCAAKKFSVWADCGLNDLFGSLKGDGKIECARLVRIDPEIKRLYYDLEFACSWCFDFDDLGEIQTRLKEAVAKAVSLIRDDLQTNKMKACELLEAAMFSEIPNSPKAEINIYAIGHAHMDLAWLWPIRETKRKLARTFATALLLGERHPSYIYGCSQAQAFAWMKEEYPQLYKRIKDAIKTGAIEVLGAMWVEPDCNLPSGEAFIRQIIEGKKFFKEEFGIEPDLFWIPDSFGYSPQLPQILLKSGIKYFFTQKLSWNMKNRFPYHSFWWQGIDGSRVLSHMLPEETYNSPAFPRSAIKIEREYAQRDVSKNALMAFGIGDGGGGPGEEHLERIKRNRQTKLLPKIKNAPVAEFLKEFEKDSSKFPTWTGDLYLEKHQGTFTTQGLNKRYNRLCECLLKEAEFAMYMLEMYGEKIADKNFLQDIWREVLLYQFHDILPGSSIKRVYDESVARYKIIADTVENFISNSLRALAEKFGASLLFNFTSWEADTRRFGKIPANGFRTLSQTKDNCKGTSRNEILENECLRVSFNENGAIVSILNKRTATEFLDANAPANEFFVYDDKGDAWDFSYDYRKQTPEKMKLVSINFLENALDSYAELQFVYKNSMLFQSVHLHKDEIIFESAIDWQDKQKMLRARTPLGFKAKKSASEVAFGYYEREVDDSTAWRAARIETPAHQWVNMQGENCGLAILNNGKYGYRLKDNAIEMNMLRCVPCPAGALVFASDISKAPESLETADFADLGLQKFTYAIYPHEGKFQACEIAAKSRALNHPPKIIDIGKHSGDTITVSLVKINSRQVELSGIKPSEDGKTWIARFVNLSNETVSADISFEFPPKEIFECSLSEKPNSESAKDLNSVSFAPFEIKSFILKY